VSHDAIYRQEPAFESVRHGGYSCGLCPDGVMKLESWYRGEDGELTAVTHRCNSCSRYGYLICDSPELTNAIKEIERREMLALGRIAEHAGGV
jgi:hypothetical protein